MGLFVLIVCSTPGSLKPIILPVDLESIAIKVARSENLNVLPQIVSTILRMVEDPNASSRHIERIIERDPAITAKILRVANSSYYGGQQVPSIGRAVSLLGLNAVRSLVVSVAYQQVISTKSQSKLFDKLQFWKHSLAVATGARILAKMKMPMKAEEMYGAGMMHDVGMLVMERFAPDDFDKAIALSRDQRIPLHVAEQEVYGFDHTTIGSVLADKWSLTPLIQNAIHYHHNVMADLEQTESTCIVAASEAMAHQAGIGNNSGATTFELDPVAEMTLGLPPEQYPVIAQVMADEVNRAQQAFQI